MGRIFITGYIKIHLDIKNLPSLRMIIYLSVQDAKAIKIMTV
jgi:hypothetical protein